MSHIPVNHHLRPFYRVVAALTAGWLLVFGAVGLDQTQGAQWFARGDWHAFGLPTNRGFAVASLAAGALVLLAVLVGTDANVFNVAIETAVVSYLIGLMLLSAGLYSKTVHNRGPTGE
jgi:hypothetical protein